MAATCVAVMDGPGSGSHPAIAKPVPNRATKTSPHHAPMRWSIEFIVTPSGRHFLLGRPILGTLRRRMSILRRSDFDCAHPIARRVPLVQAEFGEVVTSRSSGCRDHIFVHTI